MASGNAVDLAKEPTYLLSRPPGTDDELHALVEAVWGVNIPRKQICENHVAPFTAFSHAFFAKAPNYAVWYGSRGTGKSYLLAVLALTKAIFNNVDVTILGGSMAQSANVHEHIRHLLDRPNAPVWTLVKNIETEIITRAGNYIRPLAASPTTVRGPHPALGLLDEVDEMDPGIYSSAMGQALKKENPLGIEMNEYVVASSTWQHPIGTFTDILRDARARRMPIFTWCYREQLKPHGWMDPDYIQRKKASVPAEMWRVEYELGEPSGEHSAFDVAKLNEAFVAFPFVSERHAESDDEWVIEQPVSVGSYAAGADWAKAKDFTVISVVRTDVTPHKVVYIRRVNRRDWPTMIGYFNEVCQRYRVGAKSAHDATGMGNVIADFVDDRSLKVQMIGQKRIELLTDYINAVERGVYALPSGTTFYDAHKGTTVDDVYSTSMRWDAHMPDEVVSMAMVHRAITRAPAEAGGEAIKKKDDGLPTWLKRLHASQPASTVQRVGDVYVEEDDAEVGVLYID